MNRALPTSGFEVGAVGKIGFQNGIIGPPQSDYLLAGYLFVENSLEIRP